MPGTASSGGRNKKSAKRHRLEGTFQKVRHGKERPPADPPKGRPPTPKTLKGEALAEWGRMVDRLDLTRTLSIVDDAALYQYCCLFAETEGIQEFRVINARLLAKLERALERVRFDEEIAKVATAIAALQKLEAKHLQQLRQGHMGLRQFLVEFGMTPAARSRVSVTDAPAPLDPFAEFDTPPGSTH